MGFEPTVPSRVLRFSRPVHSTALPNVHIHFILTIIFCKQNVKFDKNAEFLTKLYVARYNAPLVAVAGS